MTELGDLIERLGSQVSRAEPVLFTGAGFSCDARDVTGQPLPSSKDLTAECWKLAFPDEPFDGSAVLGDAFFAARRRDPKALSQVINKRLSVDTRSLPDLYRVWFSIPWVRGYTLNIDDLEIATANRYKLSRPISSVSATSGKRQADLVDDALEVIHLNGALGDELGDLTFSAIDYGGRLASPDQWLVRCLSDLVARPVVFVGTELDEPTLWQYLECRKTKGTRGLRELRPGSILVSPSLNHARRLLLKELHVDWVQMTAGEFADQVLRNLGHTVEQGRGALRIKASAQYRATFPRQVSELATEDPQRKTEYLLGEEPQWADLQSGRAIERECDGEIWQTATTILASVQPERPLVLTGTAGSGKSTSLMRLGLRLSGHGFPTYWIDESSNIETHRLRDLIVADDKPVAILVDDADLWGRVASAWARDLPTLRPRVLIVMATRSSKVDGLLDSDTLGGVNPYEIAMPHLADNDIEDLIRVLDQENRLGKLKGKTHQERILAFQKEAGRQLLVAMIQATSGERFAEKAVREFTELQHPQNLLYALICFVHSQRFSLGLDEILTAANSRDNATLNALERLATRNLVVRDDRYSGYRSRHRHIADQVVNSPEFKLRIREVIEGICAAFASNLAPEEPRSSRRWRRFIRFINHEFLLNFLAPEDGRQVYEALEGLLNWDYHYWLQRGSLEVQEGDLSRATNYLSQARSLASEDPLVQAEWAYIQMKRAATYPQNTNAHEWFSDGFESLVELIASRGRIDPYPYHIIGSQTLAWARSARLAQVEKRGLLGKALELVSGGLTYHSRSEQLARLRNDLKDAWLATAVAE